MVRLNRIYTKTGDDGSTGLVGGGRRSKADARIEACGDVDETNACLGMARVHSGGDPDLDRVLSRIQNELFDLGADLATPDDPAGSTALRVADSQVAALEADIDRFNASLGPLDSFVLPGGSAASAALHLARTVCRRAERRAVALVAGGESVGGPVLRYLNRLSDLLFVAARRANASAGDVLWRPGATRGSAPD